MTPFLFVYGTLLPDAKGALGASQRLKLSGVGDYLGPAHMQGVLLDLGGYPGMIPGPGTVHGAVYRLHDIAATLEWLDVYEGVTGKANDEYHRLEQEAAFPAGQVLDAWTYVFIGNSQGLCKIVSGRWQHRPPN